MHKTNKTHKTHNTQNAYRSSNETLKQRHHQKDHPRTSKTSQISIDSWTTAIKNKSDHYQGKFSTRICELIHSFEKASWFKCLILIWLSYIFTCFCFGVLYGLLEFLVYENVHDHPKQKCVADTVGNGNCTNHCFRHADNNSEISLISLLQFSYETQTTIGYGHHYVSDDCYLGIILIWVHTILTNVILQPILSGMIIRKLRLISDEKAALENKAVVSSIRNKLNSIEHNVSMARTASCGQNDTNSEKNSCRKGSNGSSTSASNNNEGYARITNLIASTFGRLPDQNPPPWSQTAQIPRSPIRKDVQQLCSLPEEEDLDLDEEIFVRADGPNNLSSKHDISTQTILDQSHIMRQNATSRDYHETFTEKAPSLGQISALMDEKFANFCYTNVGCSQNIIDKSVSFPRFTAPSVLMSRSVTKSATQETISRSNRDDQPLVFNFGAVGAANCTSVSEGTKLAECSAQCSTSSTNNMTGPIDAHNPTNQKINFNEISKLIDQKINCQIKKSFTDIQHAIEGIQPHQIIIRNHRDRLRYKGTFRMGKVTRSRKGRNSKSSR